MGTLASAMGYGGAATSAQNSQVWGAASTGVGAVGNILTGVGGLQQASYAARVAQTNAALQRSNAAATIGAGNEAEEASLLRTGATVAQQKAAQGANNVDVNIGSPVAVRDSTRAVGSMDAALIHYNAARAAYGQEIDAGNQAAQAKLDRQAGVGALLEGGYKSASSILAGASGLSSKWAQYGLAFGGAQ